MGLDAKVWCNCLETGQINTPHPFPELLFVDEEGGVDIASKDEDKIDAHDAWCESSPCKHEYFTLLHHYLGNMWHIAGIRNTISRLSNTPDTEYPILWSQVIYSGIHAGDWLNTDEVKHLKLEVTKIRSLVLSKIDNKDVRYLTDFLQQIDELIEASLSVNKPIAF